MRNGTPNFPDFLQFEFHWLRIDKINKGEKATSRIGLLEIGFKVVAALKIYSIYIDIPLALSCLCQGLICLHILKGDNTYFFLSCLLYLFKRTVQPPKKFLLSLVLFIYLDYRKCFILVV